MRTGHEAPPGWTPPKPRNGFVRGCLLALVILACAVIIAVCTVVGIAGEMR